MWTWAGQVGSFNEKHVSDHWRLHAGMSRADEHVVHVHFACTFCCTERYSVVGAEGTFRVSVSTYQVLTSFLLI